MQGSDRRTGLDWDPEATVGALAVGAHSCGYRISRQARAILWRLVFGAVGIFIYAGVEAEAGCFYRSWAGVVGGKETKEGAGRHLDSWCLPM